MNVRSVLEVDGYFKVILIFAAVMKPFDNFKANRDTASKFGWLIIFDVFLLHSKKIRW